jgi:hypothetical protein
MSLTTKLGLSIVAAEQDQKHVPVNETFRRLDAIVQLTVIDRDLTAPPGSPAEGDVYIPASGGTGDWDDFDLNLALFADGQWIKIVPRTGWIAFIEDEAVLLAFDGADWTVPTAWLPTPTPPPTTQVFTADGTWNRPTGCKKVKVTVVGDGGGGGGADGGSSQAGVGGGGGGGGTSSELIDVTATPSVAVTVGQGGAGGTAGNNAGSAGTGSAFGAHCSASGGSGGSSMAAGTSVIRTAGGAGGVGSGGDINAAGDPGQPGLRLSATTIVPGTGGGTSHGAGGLSTGSNNAAGLNGRAYGGGGSGGTSNTTTDRAGGEGAPGVVIVEEFY